jgi:hypothetical protein
MVMDDGKLSVLNFFTNEIDISWNICKLMSCTPRLLDGLNYIFKGEIIRMRRILGCSLARSTLGIEGRVGTLRWGLGRVISKSIIHLDLHEPNKLVSA